MRWPQCVYTTASATLTAPLSKTLLLLANCTCNDARMPACTQVTEVTVQKQRAMISNECVAGHISRAKWSGVRKLSSTHMRCIQILFFSQSTSGKGCRYAWRLRGQAHLYFFLVTTAQAWQQASGGYIISQWKVNTDCTDEILLSLSELICILCVWWQRGENHMHATFQ